MAIITLYRGTRNDVELRDICTHQTAGGKASNPTRGRPVYNKEIQNQESTGGECFPLIPGQVIPIPTYVEYTSDKTVASTFGSRGGGGVVCIQVDDSLVLVRGGRESGHFLFSDTPVTIVYP